jgi:hypothetical protein
MRLSPGLRPDENPGDFWRWLARGAGATIVGGLVARLLLPVDPLLETVLAVGIAVGLVVGAVALVISAMRGTKWKRELDRTVARLDAAAAARPDAITEALERRRANGARD